MIILVIFSLLRYSPDKRILRKKGFFCVCSLQFRGIQSIIARKVWQQAGMAWWQAQEAGHVPVCTQEKKCDKK